MQVVAGALLKALLATAEIHQVLNIHIGGAWRCRSSQEGVATSIPAMVLIDHPVSTRSVTLRMVHQSWSWMYL